MLSHPQKTQLSCVIPLWLLATYITNTLGLVPVVFYNTWPNQLVPEILIFYDNTDIKPLITCLLMATWNKFGLANPTNTQTVFIK